MADEEGAGTKESEDTPEIPAEQESDEWKEDKYRNKVVERIQDEITKTESEVPKSAADLEEFVFSKAKSRKDYLDLVARLLIYVAEFNKKKNKESQKNSEDVQDAPGGKDEEESKEGS